MGHVMLSFRYAKTTQPEGIVWCDVASYVVLCASKKKEDKVTIFRLLRASDEALCQIQMGQMDSLIVVGGSRLGRFVGTFG